MKVYEEIKKRIAKGKVHMTLIDPASQDPVKSAVIAEEAERAGSDFIMVGGSTDINIDAMDQCVDHIKKHTSLKTILFPGSSSMVSKQADAIYFMSLMNSTDPDFIVRHQMKASCFLKETGLEAIPMGYLIFEPGMTVGKVGKAELLRGDDYKLALSYSLAAQFFGMKLMYFEAGSGANSHVPASLISKVRPGIDLPLIVGGGIRSPEAASIVSKAGADIVVTGTVTEKSDKVYDILEPIISAIKA
ncbi:MAG: geranylgeranylglyceryl/heptaprenylglyceryl phosphate synthase [Thermoplasmataceae archaeon]